MTITTTQLQVVQTAVNTIMNGKDLESVFLPNVKADNLNELISNFNDLTNAFEINELDTTQHDIDVALDTLERVANNIVDYYDMNVFSELCDYHDFFEALEIVENESLVLHHDVFEMSEIAENYVNECGMPSNWEFYLDEQALLRDLHLGGDIQDYYYHNAYENSLEDGKTDEQAQDIASDYEITTEDEQNYLELVIECASNEFKQRYFDFEALGRDFEIEGTYFTCDTGMIEVTM